MDNFKSYLQQLRFDQKLWNSLHAKWITNMRLVLLLVIGIFAAGLISMFTLPRRLNPEVKIPIVIVSTVLPGAGPEDVESLVTRPIEDALNGVEKLDTMTSVSRDNVSIITMQFVSSANSDKARDDVQSLVDTVTMPEDAQSPKVMALDFENQPIWTFMISSHSDPATLMRFADELKEKIEDISTVKSAEVSGFESQEISVVLNPEKMREYGVNPFLLSQTVSKAAASYPAGTLEDATSSFSLTIDPDITTVNDIRNLRIETSDTSVRLGDIASVSEKAKSQQVRSFVSSPGEKPHLGVTFNVFKTSTANIDTTAKHVEDLVNAEVKKHNGQFMVTNVLNAGTEITKQYTDLLGDFESTTLLVFVNLLLFLGLRQALLASLTIPLTFLSGLVFMNIFGMTINFISLFAFLLALGTSIDDTIVTVSSMTTYFRTRKFTPAETGLLVWRDFIVPIWSTTITTIWAYLPLLLTTGIIGEFIKPIPVVVTATMISSTFFAVMVTLPLMVYILKPTLPRRVAVMLKVIAMIAAVILAFIVLPKSPLFIFELVALMLVAAVAYRIRAVFGKHVRTFVAERPAITSARKRLGRIIDHGLIDSAWLGQRYRGLISRILHAKHGRRNTLIAVVSFALFAYMLVPMGLVKNEFFPKADADILYINLSLPAGTNITSVETEALRVTNELRNTPEVEHIVTDVGTEFNGQGTSSNGSSALITLILKPKDERHTSSIDIAQQLREKYRNYGAGTLSVQEQSGGPPAGSDIQITLLGDDLSTLDSYAEKVVSFLKNDPGITTVDKSIKSGTSKLVFVPDKAKMAEAGVTPDQLGLLLRTYASGFTLDKIKFENKEKDVVFRLMDGSPSTTDIGSLTVQTQTGGIPLVSLGELKLENNPTVITREEGKRTISVSAGVKPGFVVGDVNKRLETYAGDKLQLPSGYSWKTGGVNEENTKSVQSIFQAMGLSALLILVTMVIQFGSFRQAAIVLLLIPLAISGVFIIFSLTATPLSFPALIGILALFGVVVTNAMFIVDKINRNRQEGMDLNHAIADAAESRLEPIMLTSITTILGLIPITISDPLWRGLGGAIIAGLSFSGIIMLFFVPVVYYVWFRGDEEKKRNTV